MTEPNDADRERAIAERGGFEYARNVDKSPRDDTRAAATREGQGREYAAHVDESPH